MRRQLQKKVAPTKIEDDKAAEHAIAQRKRCTLMQAFRQGSVHSTWHVKRSADVLRPNSSTFTYSCVSCRCTFYKLECIYQLPLSLTLR